MVLSLVTWDSFWPSAALARVGPGDDSRILLRGDGPFVILCRCIAGTGPNAQQSGSRAAPGVFTGAVAGVRSSIFSIRSAGRFELDQGRNAARAARVDALVKKIGFLSSGHWSSSPGSHTRSASDALLQSIDLAVAAEELGADGAYCRVRHLARQRGSPFPLLAAEPDVLIQQLKEDQAIAAAA